jgi:LysR family nitrogen assimilation transcriptional regulator
MDLKQLEYFVRVAELGSFTRAGVVLGVAQPALSRQVRLLEVELRQNLLLRNGRGVRTTDAGQVLLEHGRGILHQVRHAREALARVRGAVVGQVALGLPPSLARILTVPLTRQFQARFPESALSIREGLSVTMQESLVSGRLDLALLYNAAATPDIEIEPLFEEELFLIAPLAKVGKSDKPAKPSKAIPATRAAKASPRLPGPQSGAGPLLLRDLARLPLVIPSRPNAIRMQVEAELANLGLHPSIALEVDGIWAIHDLVADGAGFAVLSMSAVSTFPRPEAFRVRRIVQPSMRCKVAIASSSRRPATLIQRAVMDLLRETVGRILPRTAPAP